MRKRLLSMLSAVAMLTTTIPYTYAEEADNPPNANSTYYSEWGIYFDKPSGTVTDCNKNKIVKAKNPILPSEIDGVSVASIGDNAFGNCGELKDVYYSGTEEQWKNISIGSYNSPLTSANIHYNSYGGGVGSSINAGIVSSINSASTKNLNITVYENEKDNTSDTDKYILSGTAAVKSDGNNYSIDLNGMIDVKISNSGDLTVSKSGFLDKTVTPGYLENSKNIYLQKDAEKGPVINGVMVGNVDVLTGEYKINLTSKDKITLNAEIVWKSGAKDKVYLVQGARRKDFSGNTLTTTLSDDFDVSKAIYIVAIDKDGNSTKKKLGFANDGKVPEALNGIGLDLGNSITGTIPGNNPFFGGGQIGLDLPAKLLPISISVEDNKIYATVGIDVVKYKTGTDSDSKDKKTKFLFDNIKKDWKNVKDGLKDLKNIGSKYKDAVAKPKASFGFTGDFSVIGFAEGYIDSNGKAVITEGGIILNPSVACEWSGQFAIGPVPCYWEAYIKAAIEAQMNLYLDQTVKNFTPNGSIEATVKLGGGGGVGLDKLIGIGGGIEGSVKPHYDIFRDRENYFKLTAKYGAYFKAFVWIFEYKKQWDSKEYLWLEYPNSIRTAELMSAEDFDIYDMSNYSLADRSYAENPSEFTANSGNAVLMEDSVNKTEQTLKTNIYTYSEPQLVQFADGKMLAVWLDDDTSRSDINRTSVYYSYYDGDKWSEPAAVNNDNTADFSPCLKLINNKAYLVWVNTKTVLNDSDASDIYKIFGQSEVFSAEFDKDKAVFENIQSVTDNSAMDMMPVIFGDNTDIYAVWVSNSSNDVFGTNADNSIMLSRLKYGNWSEPQVYKDKLYSVDSLDGAVIGGEPYIAYSVDGDGHLEDCSDKEIYLNNERITDNDTLDSNVTFDGESLYWYSNGNISEYRVLDKTSENILKTGYEISNDRFKVISNGESKAIVFEKSEGLVSELCAYFYDSVSRKWGNKTDITDFEASINGFSGTLNEDGKMSFLINKTAVAGGIDSANPYGQTDLSMVTVTPSVNLTLGDVYYDSDTLLAGNTLEFSTDITNNGELAVDEYVVEVIDESGNVLSSTYSNEAILPGEAHKFTVYYNLGSSEFVPHSVSLRLRPLDGEELNEGDNVYTAALNHKDIAVEGISYGINSEGRAVIYGDIVNRGYGAADSVNVTLHEDSVDGNIIETKTIKAGLGTLEADAFSFTVDFEEDKLYYVTIDSDDMSSGNNSDFVILISDTEAEYDELEAIGDYAGKLEIKKELTDNRLIITIIPSDTADITASELSDIKLYAAKYDESGILEELITGKKSISDNKLIITADLPNPDNYKIMIWNESLHPLTYAIENK